MGRQRVRLHVDDHPRPLDELRRLLVLRRAHDLLEEADEHVAAGDLDAAVEGYAGAVELAPDEPELRFWAAVSLFTAGAASRLFPDDLAGMGR